MDTAVVTALTEATADLSGAILGVLATSFTAGIAVAVTIIGLAFGWGKFKKFAGLSRRR